MGLDRLVAQQDNDEVPAYDESLRWHAGWHLGGPARLVSVPLSGPGDWAQVARALDPSLVPPIEIEPIDDEESEASRMRAWEEDDSWDVLDPWSSGPSPAHMAAVELDPVDPDPVYLGGEPFTPDWRSADTPPVFRVRD